MPCPRADIRALSAALVAAVAVACGCDGETRAPEAAARVTVPSAELSIRFDVADGRAPSVSVLGFRASAAGPNAPDVLGLVDPLWTAAPDQGCALHDVDQAASALEARGESVDLEELSGVGVGFGPGEPLVRPFPRVFPDVAGVVGGVVAESTPQGLGRHARAAERLRRRVRAAGRRAGCPRAAAAGGRQRHRSGRRHAHRRQPRG